MVQPIRIGNLDVNCLIDSGAESLNWITSSATQASGCLIQACTPVAASSPAYPDQEPQISETNARF